MNLSFTLWLCQNTYGKSPFFTGKSTTHGPCPIDLMDLQSRLPPDPGSSGAPEPALHGHLAQGGEAHRGEAAG